MVLVVIATVPATLALRLAGFRSEGKTADILNERGAAAPSTLAWPSGDPESAARPAEEGEPGGGNSPVTEGPESLDSITVDLWFLTQPRTLPLDQVGAERLERGQTENGATAYYIEFGEQSANAHLNTWFGEYIEQQSRIRDPQIDLRPGGAVIYADVDMEIGWKRVGAVLMVDGTGQQIDVIGVDIDGRLYSSPPTGEIARLVQQVESEANRALRELAFVDPAGQLTIREIRVTEDRVQILAY
jgi:hypothetical protein